MTANIEMPVCVYRFFDADDRLLYVGITDDPKGRWKAHAKREWWHQVARHAITWHDTRADALAAEAAAIASEGPLHNVAGMPSTMADDDPVLLAKLTEAAERRRAADERVGQAATAERAAIVDAWRAGIAPTRIAVLAERSGAHVRNLRPEDVPPARLGGGAAPKRRKRKSTA